MRVFSDVKREHVRAAIDEWNRIGSKTFLEIHRYKPATKYNLVYNGEEYASKAILGVACGYAHTEADPLPYDAFSGGKATVVRHLRKLGFHIRDFSANTPLVLVQNEATTEGDYDFWKDATGERYHFPNQYRNRVREGRPFIYYRGSRRADGAKSAPEYFGWGFIGPVSRDADIPEDEPKNRWRWYCEIRDYHPFDLPVPARIEGKYLEQIKYQNQWQVGVREVSDHVLSEIIRIAGADSGLANKGLGPGPAPTDAHISTEYDQNLLVPTGGRRNGFGGASHSRSRFAKAIGDWAEEYVCEMLRTSLPQAQAETLRWVADEGRKPGWDVEYQDQLGNTVAVEVKGTTGAAFPSFELTANEWNAAKRMGASYAVILVAKCKTLSPTVQRFDDPCSLWNQNIIEVSPVKWRVTLASNSGPES